MTALLERVRFLGGNGPNEQEPSEPLPELAEGFDRDPEPSAEVRKSPRKERPAATSSPRAARPRVGGKFVSPADAQKKIADELEMYIKLGAAAWSVADEECAGALNETSALIAADFAKLAARSEWVMEKLQTTSLLGDLVTATLHARPFLQAVYRHHWSRDARARRAMGTEESYDTAVIAEPVDPYAYGPWRPATP